MTQENEIRKMDDVQAFGNIVYFILSGHEINKFRSVLTSFSLPAQQLIQKCFYNDVMHRPTFEMILLELEQIQFNIASLSQQEIEEALKLISQFKKQISS